ncbi:MAG: hypothetical protein IK032_00215 [Bacteroidales bacterium]|nr:hypothetical protein [Bacteroidales bacterium]
MKLTQLHEGKQYASVTDILLGTGYSAPVSVMKQPTDNGYKATTSETKPIAHPLDAETTAAPLTSTQIRNIVAEELARQAAANNGTTAAASTDTAEEPETVELPEPAEEPQNTSQKILAWAKDNMLIVGLAAAVIIYIMYRRAQ